MEANFKMIYFCQRCQKKHDRTEEAIFETGVKCKYCNGYVVSPSGRAIIKLELTAKIYIVYGLTKLACIGAKNKSDALDHFIENVEEDYHRVDEMTNQEMQESQFLFDPNQRGIEEEYISVSGMEFITSVSAEDLPSLVLLLDNEDMINYFDNKRKNEDES